MSQARGHVGPNEVIVPISLVKIEYVHVIQMINLGLTIVEEPGVTCWKTLNLPCRGAFNGIDLDTLPFHVY